MNENKKEKFRSGMATIVGRPNVGKSTLLNTILNQKVAIVSKVPQTTRNQIRGIYNNDNGQIVFIDTPGMHLSKDKLSRFMNESSTATIYDADCIVYLVDCMRKIGEEEEYIVEKLVQVKCPVILALNKVDASDEYLSDYIALWEKAKGISVQEMPSFTLLALSGLKETNIDKLIEIIFSYLPEGPALYPTDMVSDVPQRLALSEIIREKLFMIMRQEIPHSIGVVIEDMQPRKKKTINIKALIVVEKESQKEIVIGKGGQVLKKVGTSARGELETLLESKVFLELYVKTQKNWRDNISTLAELGYTYS